eukprot:TRINITY_DN13182_c0_g1_i1.p1 TRINITY_DN13182_c0_g1~~TRINITY_DN13182_c0_g1_i1.p1  ORF type:complete len:219 (+),score=22.51 TRINITY_DN13182_c0_g1_i1:79-735(+)
MTTNWQPVQARVRSATLSAFRQEENKPALVGLTPENLKKLVALPQGENRLEWIAANVIDFYNQINMLYGLVFARCTEVTCPTMQASSRFEYLWVDGDQYKTPVALSAPKYIELLMKWVNDLIANPKIFPVLPQDAFPDSFEATAQSIFKRLFRVYAHIFHHHLQEVIGLGAEAHLTSSCMHLIFFIRKFKLVKSVDLLPLKELIARYEGSKTSSDPRK